MTVRVTVDQPNRPAGDPIEVPPIGVVENGKTVEVDLTHEQAAFVATGYGVSVTSGGKNVKPATLDSVPVMAFQSSAEPPQEGGDGK